MEDLDLDLRLQLAGFPSSTCLTRSFIMSGRAPPVPAARFNLLRSAQFDLDFVKNIPGLLFYLLLPAHVLYNLLYLLASLFMPAGKALRQKKRRAEKASQMLAKRKIIQSRRKISLFQFAKLLDWNPFTPLIKLTYR